MLVRLLDMKHIATWLDRVAAGHVVLCSNHRSSFPDCIHQGAMRMAVEVMWGGVDLMIIVNFVFVMLICVRAVEIERGVIRAEKTDTVQSSSDRRIVLYVGQLHFLTKRGVMIRSADEM